MGDWPYAEGCHSKGPSARNKERHMARLVFEGRGSKGASVRFELSFGLIALIEAVRLLFS